MIFVNLISSDLRINCGYVKFVGKVSYDKKGRGKKPYEVPKNDAPKDVSLNSSKGPMYFYCKDFGHIRWDVENSRHGSPGRQ
jgi:hypothetical protein